MFAKAITYLTALVLLSGCAGEAGGPRITADHPAHPDAVESPLPAPSETLALGSAAPVSISSEASRTTRPAGGAALYTCPHHPEVTSDKPGQTCPKCRMKLIEKETKAAPGAGHGGHP